MEFYGLYKITNLVNGKMYIGQHVTEDIDDGYMGSGVVMKRALRKYGAENFRKEWLGFYEDKEELDYMERVFVDDTWVSRSDTYNLCVGGKGGQWFGKSLPDSARAKLSQAMKGKRIRLGKKHTDETKRKLSERAKKRLAVKSNHPNYGKHNWTGDKNPMKRPEVRAKISNLRKGTHMNEEQKMRVSEARRKFCKEHPGSNNRNQGKHWYNNGEKSVLAYECPIGYVGGRI